jgi:hypothetical protein
MAYWLDVCDIYGILPAMDQLYTDSDLETATGLPTLHVRRLITWGAVTPAAGGKGVVRQWDRREIRHIASIAALYAAGLSLPMAHTLGMLIPARFALNMIDPEAGIQKSARDKWFNPKVPLRVIEPADVILSVINGTAVHWQLGRSGRVFVGELANERSVLMSALDYSKFDECDPASLSWQFEPDLATRRAQAAAAEEFKHPISVTTINLSLACKIAMRRLLGIPVFFALGSKA